MHTPMIGVLAEGRYLDHAQPRGVMAALADRGVEVALLADADDAQGCDLVLARGRSDELLARLGDIEAAGVPTLNRRAAIEGVVDKALMHATLVGAGVPVPDTWIGSFEEICATLGDESRAIVVKPVRGDNGRDVHLASNGRALRSIWWQEPDVIAQRYLPNDGFDIKLYCAGERVWTVRKPSPVHRRAGVATLQPTTAAHQDLAHRCGTATGLDLFGVDCIATADGLVVIEVNDFPNYSGIPDADAALAAHVLAAAGSMAGVS